MIHARRTTYVRYAIEIAVGIRSREVECWWQIIIRERETANCGFNRAGCAQRVGVEWFGRADWNPTSVFAEDAFDRQRFRFVAERRTGGMGIYVINAIRAKLRIRQSVLDTACSARTVRTGREHVVGVVVASVAEDLRERTWRLLRP